MKKTTIIALTAAIAVTLAGCQGNWDGTHYSKPSKAERCAFYAAAYATYEAVSATRKPSKDEVVAANAAAAFLSLYCGWQKTRGRDKYGVEVVIAP